LTAPAFSQQAPAPTISPTTIPASGRWLRINQDSAPAIAGMTANNIATDAAP